MFHWSSLGSYQNPRQVGDENEKEGQKEEKKQQQWGDIFDSTSIPGPGI